MAKIVTITLNTSIDNIIEVERFERGKALRSKSSLLFPSGKGINVAKIIAAARRDVTALGLVGQNSRHHYDKLENAKMKVRLIEVPGETRRNITIVDSQGILIAHINNPGFAVNEQDLNKLEKIVQETVLPGDVVVISGSLPLRTDPTTYQRLVELCKSQKALVILDTSGKALAGGMRAKPYMIKPNLEELQTLLGESLKKSQSAIRYASGEILKKGVSMVVVSLGPSGVIVVYDDNHRAKKAKITIDDDIVLSHKPGSGDALVGGFAIGLLEDKRIDDTIRLGVACGAASQLVMGPGECRLHDIERMIPQVQIEEL
jgi:1-phosphofructokinase family hexose kinase